ncbi:MAG: IS200/IS605 family transposase [Caldilineaceae bacterium]
MRQQIYQLMQQQAGVEVLEFNIQEDQVHLVLWIPPKYAVSAIMGFLKGKLAIRVFARFLQLGRRYWGRHLWSRGYCVSTIGIDEEMIRQYVRWQAQQAQPTEYQQAPLIDG